MRPGHMMGYKVFKYPLTPQEPYVDGYVRIEAPCDAKVVLVDHQEHVPTIWLEVATEKDHGPCKYRLFKIYGTGHIISDYDVHRGSYKDGPFVWHVYESNP